MLRFFQGKNVKTTIGIMCIAIGSYILTTILSTSLETTLLFRGCSGAVGGALLGVGITLTIQACKKSSSPQPL